MGRENNIYSGSLINGPNIYSSIRDASSILKIGNTASRLRIGEFLGDVLIGQEYSSIHALVKRDSMGTSIEANEVASGTYNSARFGIYSKTLIINSEYTGNGLYRVEFMQKVYNESKEGENPELMAHANYLSSNLISANVLEVGSVLRIIKIVSSIQISPKNPIDRLGA